MVVYGCGRHRRLVRSAALARPGTCNVTSSLPLLETRLGDRLPDRRGKVRDLFDLGDTLLIVATDRISAFDYVLGSGIPDKGKVLTQLSEFWFQRTGDIVPNHVIDTAAARRPELRAYAEMLDGRAMVVRRTTPVPIECVARGYLSGSGWKEYQTLGTVCGIALPAGLRESDRLPNPIFTPATKAESGHDINISTDDAGTLIGHALITRLRDLTLALYAHGAAHAESCGILLADTKFEFGLTGEGELILIDEAMTPDSSRYWPTDQYQPGGPQPSFDKQFVRDYLEAIHWDKQPPVPSLPDEVVSRTRLKYLEAFRRLTGKELD
jgi:phosphoribosylaminoimidazole-succinocarboxamide synthase